MNAPKRKILLVVSGFSPQIVTETLYSLVTRAKNPWIPNEIQLLSTYKGCEIAKNDLLHPSRNKFGAFCKAYLPSNVSIKFDETCIHPFVKNGVELEDILDLDDSAIVADTIAQKVWELTQHADTEIHASIAGGRKSMGFLLGYCMSMYGRPQDRLSHVLVSKGFEGHPDFFYPPKKSIIIKDKEGVSLNTSHAVINLAEIPILHLRNKLNSKKMLTRPVSFAQAVENMNLSLQEPSLYFNVKKQILKCHGKQIKLQPIDFSFYLFMAKHAADKAFDLGRITLEDYLEIQNLNHDHAKQKEDLKKHEKSYNDGLKVFFADRKTKIKTAMESKLGGLADFYVVHNKRQKGDSLNLMPHQITIENE